ncbi:MAG: leucyl/phenylalanyl-tRNA--protein transferase [Gammaproteobacteria bacterium]|nr:leucyl/phenylalanyl-tRNA--protein transferase [Gammaproteobacteria bacterium]MBU0786021.1 leucyl/phenylalanyl-tRNA--protein transferase [Gammaproteobacteria bacterium]MBU0814390.1 leucyl/phenylalanyl-tRNA--protein transferase [Gammaproteobacteria bacterium]MBU1786765.1 leucyl/phenylalanyl-tRNA--protein transferase [Gammaproteobacteria bacterium]
MPTPALTLPWLEAGEAFPPVEQAWGHDSPMPGLLAAGGELNVATLCEAYARGIFPWFSEGQPNLWWSPDPRMVLDVAQFRLHRSLRKTLGKFRQSHDCEIRFDSAFEQTIQACSSSPRHGQGGTWILPAMVRAYIELHRAGIAHSVEVWTGGELVGGLYCVSLGKAVFGESMFSRQADASKIALAALVGFCRHHGIKQIDCQQNTSHLASLGAQEIPRADFLARVRCGLEQPAPQWQFEALYWREILPSKPDST